MKNRTKGKYTFMDYLRDEIGIEYKACLYFFALLFCYSCYRLYLGIYSAELLHLGEMILTTYIMNYIQLFLMGNFDESDRYGLREFGFSLLCCGIYTATAHLCGWFGRDIIVELIFFVFWMFTYFCAYLVNKIRRSEDTRQLNEELERFRKGEKTK